METAQPRTVLALMGSGETSPTMVTVHRDLVSGLGPGPVAVVLDTPYGFQENVAEISARAQQYFSHSVGLSVTVPRELSAPMRDTGQLEAELTAARSADWLFAGPGSPTYALSRWRGSPVEDALRDRLGPGPARVTVFASAAACTVGRLTVPVYEIYKVGAPPRWVDGLDLLTAIGLPVAVIPHYDNTEGGTHDTRYCYLGERRLRMLEESMPDEAAVLGVDEHTAVILDLTAGTVEVRGRGGLTVRRAGVSTVVPAGEGLTLDHLRDLVAGRHAPAEAVAADPGPPAPRPDRDAGAEPASLRETVLGCERRFEAALAARDVAGLVRAVVDIDAAISAWSADMEEEDDPEAARAVQHSLIARLGELAALGLRDPRELLAPVVEPLVTLRAELRTRQAWPLADAVRDALRGGGVELQDSENGTRWEWQPAAESRS